MAHDVFICHSSKDKLVADAACNVLEARGIRCWVAPRDVLPGRPYAESILNAISEARVLVVVFSSHANASNQVSKEVERAVNRGIPILPLRIEDVAPTRSLEYFISESHWLDAVTPPLQTHLQHLASVIQRLLDDEGAEPRAAGAAEAIRRPGRGGGGLSPWPLGAGLAALLIVVGLGFWFTSASKAGHSEAPAAPSRLASDEMSPKAPSHAPAAGPAIPTPSVAKPHASSPPPKANDGDLAETSVKVNYRTGVFTTQRDASCDKRGAVASEVGESLPISIRNSSGQPLRLYWIGVDGKENPTTSPTESPFLAMTGGDTYYLVTDESGQCIRIFRATKTYSHFNFVSPGAASPH